MKEFIKKLIFSILCLGFLLLAMEIPLRIFWYSPASAPKAPPLDSEGFFVFESPQQPLKHQATKEKTRQEVTVQSQREVEPQQTITSPTTEKETQQEIALQSGQKRDPYRILLLGDSFAFGIGVRMQHRFSDVLNTMLGDKVEVINEGRGGWCTASELLLFLEEWYKYRPNMVIYQFFWNDILENMRCCSSPDTKSKLREKGISVEMKAIDSKAIDKIFYNKGTYKTIDHLRAWLYHHSSLFNALRAFYVKTGLLELMPINEVKHLDINLTLDLTRQLRDKVKEQGVDKFLVAVVPYNGPKLFANSLWPTLKDLLDKENIPYIYPSDEFVNNLDTYYIPVDGHFSVQGNRRFAEHLYKLIINLEPSLAAP